MDTVRAIRQARFVSTVTASGEIVATWYADIGSSVMGKITHFSAIPSRWAVAAGLTISVGVAAGYWLAQRAAGLDPVEALRHE